MTMLIEMLNDSNHSNFSYGYKLMEGTLYNRFIIRSIGTRKWLLDNGFTHEQVKDGFFYRPIAKKENGEYIGWHCGKPNPSVWFLSMNDKERELLYPNLYWVDRGLFPYPKQVYSLNISWFEDQYHRECHRILLPPENPLEFFYVEMPTVLDT